jgi:hypothetical protein
MRYYVRKKNPFIPSERAEIHGENIEVFIFYRDITKVRRTLSLI